MIKQIGNDYSRAKRLYGYYSHDHSNQGRCALNLGLRLMCRHGRYLSSAFSRAKRLLKPNFLWTSHVYMQVHGNVLKSTINISPYIHLDMTVII